MNSNLSSATPSATTSDEDVDLSVWLNLNELCHDFFIPVTDGPEATSIPVNDINTTKLLSTAQNLPLQGNEDTDIQPQLTAQAVRPPSKDSGRNVNIPQYSVICFPSNPSKPKGIKKKRKDFDERRRLEVAQVRRAGACFRCKVRRISVRYPPGY